jgi:hypothetical protein
MTFATSGTDIQAVSSIGRIFTVAETAIGYLMAGHNLKSLYLQKKAPFMVVGRL